MRIRTIKPEFWTDSFMVSLPPLARLIFISLFSVADDHGYIEDEPERIAMQVMPKEDSLDVEGWIDFFVAAGRVEMHVSPEGKTYLGITNWAKHQRVDNPGKSKLFREGSRKLAIPFETRRKVATKYKCTPGATQTAGCYYCGREGRIHWHSIRGGRPSAWVSFSGLELDHVIAECGGGSYTDDNIVLACRNCNRSKGQKDWFDFLSSRALASPRETLPLSRELSLLEQGSGKGKEGKGISPRPESAAPTPDGQGDDSKDSKDLPEEAWLFVDWFLSLLKRTGAPEPKLTEANRRAWADTYDKLIRLDGRTKEQIKAVCEWAREDSFWRANFLSPAKLREKVDGVTYFDRFTAKMSAAPQGRASRPPSLWELQQRETAIREQMRDLSEGHKGQEYVGMQPGKTSPYEWTEKGRAAYAALGRDLETVRKQIAAMPAA